MNREELVRAFPKIMAKMDEDIDELRYLTVVDENYNDPEVDDEDVFDPVDYNYMIYLTEGLQEILGSELLERLPELIEAEGIYQNFLASEIDLYGAWCDGDAQETARRLLGLIERHLPDA